MTAHLTLPYNWKNCAHPETCPQQIHLQDTAETLNTYPTEWVEAMFNCEIKEEAIRYNDTHQANGQTVEWKNGTKEWFLNGKRHRENGPARECADGTHEWYRHGERHRENGPAIIRADGTEEWYQDDKRHRENGPAVTRPDGTKEWWTNGKQVPKPPYA